MVLPHRDNGGSVLSEKQCSVPSSSMWAWLYSVSACFLLFFFGIYGEVSLNVCSPGEAFLQLPINIAGQLRKCCPCMSLLQGDQYTWPETGFYCFLMSSIIRVDCLILYFFLKGRSEREEIKMTTKLNQ